MSAELLEQAIALAQAGKQKEARELLGQVITADVHDETAWLLYADALPGQAGQVRALEECLFHNPNCSEAEERLRTLKFTQAPRLEAMVAKSRPVDEPSDRLPEKTKGCPYCAETIKAAAVVCRYCGRDLTVEDANQAGGKRRRHRRGSRTRSCAIYIFVAGVAVMAIVTWATINGMSDRPAGYSPSSGPSAAPTSTEQSTTLRVPAGKLSRYESVYSDYAEVFVEMKDGTVDPRPNDLEELCKDYAFFRRKILEYSSAGQLEKADEARASFRAVDAWLDEYDRNDFETMYFSILKLGN